MTSLPATADLEQSLEEASSEVRRAFLWFGTFAAYFVTTVAATTHENLLRGTAVKLPLLNVDLPIVGFYVIAPVLFLLLHFYLLFQLYLLAGRVRELIAAVGPQTARALGPSFPVTQYLLGGLGAFRPIFGLGIWLTVILLPALALTFVQIRFLPYHARGTTGMHMALVALDVLVTALLWCLIVRGLGVGGRGAAAGEDGTPPPPPRLVPWLGYGGLAAFVVFVLWFSLVVASIPGEEAVAVRELAPPRGRAPDPCAVQPAIEPPPMEAAAEVAEPGAFCTSLARIHDYPFRYSPPPAYPGAPARRMLCLTYLLFEAPTTPLEMRRNLDVRSKSFASGEPTADRRGIGFDLRGRDLRFADFTGADLSMADLRGADLFGASLGNARLDHADLGDVSENEFDLCEGFVTFDGAGRGFCRTVARAADLAKASLRGARLRKVDLRNARLPEARAAGIDLVEADLSGADLAGADLSTGKLRGARLEGAGLREVRATGADLTCAQARGADLSAADLSTATAGRARLGRAKLVEARLVGTYLARADLTGASLAGSYLEGVDLRAAKLIGTVWGDERNGAATLRLVDLRGTRVDTAELPPMDPTATSLLPSPDSPPDAPPPAAFDDALIALLDPLLDRPDYRTGVIGRIETERNDSCQVRRYQIQLAERVLEGACERDDRFSAAEWWVLQIARRAAVGMEGARPVPSRPARCVTGPPPSPGACEPLPWASVDTAAAAPPS
jgi:uncharacterized protein YjbI with pentapeptide repeats